MAAFVTLMSVTVTESPGWITTLPPSDRVSVALPFDKTPDGEDEVPVVSLRTCAKLGSTVPVGDAIVSMPPVCPPVALAVNPSEYLTCWTPPAADDSDTAVTD